MHFLCSSAVSELPPRPTSTTATRTSSPSAVRWISSGAAGPDVRAAQTFLSVRGSLTANKPQAVEGCRSQLASDRTKRPSEPTSQRRWPAGDRALTDGANPQATDVSWLAPFRRPALPDEHATGPIGTFSCNDVQAVCNFLQPCGGVDGDRKRPINRRSEDLRRPVVARRPQCRRIRVVAPLIHGFGM